MNYLYLYILYKNDHFFQLELLVSYKQATKELYSLKLHQGIQNKRWSRNISRVSSDPSNNPFSSQFPKSMQEFIQPSRSGAHQHWRSAGSLWYNIPWEAPRGQFTQEGGDRCHSFTHQDVEAEAPPVPFVNPSQGIFKDFLHITANIHLSTNPSLQVNSSYPEPTRSTFINFVYIQI